MLSEYRRTGGDLGNVASATSYLNARKPSGVGRINEVICGALIKQMGAIPFKAMTPDVPPVVETAPIIIAANTVTLPEVMPQKPVAVYFESPPLPETPKPAEPEPAPAQNRDPVVVAPSNESVTPPKKSLLNKLKFWKK